MRIQEALSEVRAIREASRKEGTLADARSLEPESPTLWRLLRHDPTDSL